MASLIYLNQTRNVTNQNLNYVLCSMRKNYIFKIEFSQKNIKHVETKDQKLNYFNTNQYFWLIGSKMMMNDTLQDHSFHLGMGLIMYQF